ncbi:MAG: hypothetical protein H0Z24_05485 [Thermosipho sp. (in: Bacteria)]|nr:hypothetical protein [Thermosipho sp. (in: thermotogales)]
MKKKFDVERGLISKLLETKDMVLVKDLQIKPYFFSGKHKKVFIYLNDFFLKNGELPTVRVFKKAFPDYELETYINPETLDETIGTEESLNFWCEELRKKVKHNKLADMTEQVIENLENLETEKAYSLIKKTVLYLESDVELSSSIDITKNIEERILEYKKRKENKGILGIPTGIVQLDYIIKGLQNKQLITTIARAGVGKTWLEVLIGANSLLAGYRVLQLVTEMSEEQMRDRYEAVLVGKLYGDFHYGRFKSGTLFPQEEEMYFDFLRNKLPRLEPLIIDVATGVSNVAAKIDLYKPDLVLIDSAYLMEDDRGAKEDWLRVTHITRDLKKLAKNRNIPIFINSQADKTTSKKTGPELDNIGYSRAIGEDSDVVLALFQDEQMREDREMKIKVLKQREGVLGNVLLNWDFTRMNFDPIYSTVSQEEDSKTEKEKSGVIEI